MTDFCFLRASVGFTSLLFAASALAAEPPPAAATAAPGAAAPATPPRAVPEVELEEDAKAPPSAATDPAAPAPAIVVVPPPAAPPASSTPATTSQPSSSEDPRADDGKLGSHQNHWLLDFGVRTSYVPNEGFDPFNDDNALVQTSLSVGRTLFSDEDLSFAALLLWDRGGSEALARNAETHFVSHRFTAGAEGRYHLFRRLYGFARFAPGALRWDATLEDEGADTTRDAGAWMFALDFSAGAAFEFAGENRGDSSRARGWILADGGYGWTTTSDVIFGAGENDPARLEPLALNDLSMRGAFFRISAALTY